MRADCRRSLQCRISELHGDRAGGDTRYRGRRWRYDPDGQRRATTIAPTTSHLKRSSTSSARAGARRRCRRGLVEGCWTRKDTESDDRHPLLRTWDRCRRCSSSRCAPRSSAACRFLASSPSTSLIISGKSAADLVRAWPRHWRSSSARWQRPSPGSCRQLRRSLRLSCCFVDRSPRSTPSATRCCRRSVRPWSC